MGSGFILIDANNIIIYIDGLEQTKLEQTNKKRKMQGNKESNNKYRIYKKK